MIQWSRNNIKQLNSPPNKDLNASQPRNYEEPRSQSPTPNPFKAPTTRRHHNQRADFTHKPGKHPRDGDSPPTRPRKRRRRNSRIDWAAREAKAQVCTHFRISTSPFVIIFSSVVLGWWFVSVWFVFFSFFFVFFLCPLVWRASSLLPLYPESGCLDVRSGPSHSQEWSPISRYDPEFPYYWPKFTLAE